MQLRSAEIPFNGTGGILPDWPVQMLTNSRYSPRIAHTLAYSAAEDGPISLCHDYRLVLFDYPGVGRSPLNGPVTAEPATWLRLGRADAGGPVHPMDLRARPGRGLSTGLRRQCGQAGDLSR